MNAKQAITNLQTMSQALERIANKPEIYNSDYGYYLEQFSFEMRRQAAQLREVEYLFSESNSTSAEIGV